MPSQSDNALLIDETFKSIYNLLMQNPQERQRFFEEPEKVLAEKGIEVDSKTMETIKRICTLSIDTDRMDFNEKLVLCSSSGF